MTGLAPPASAYEPSSRELPEKLAPIESPGHFEVRLVSRNSGSRWKKHWVCVTHTLAGEYVGLEMDEALEQRPGEFLRAIASTTSASGISELIAIPSFG